MDGDIVWVSLLQRDGEQARPRDPDSHHLRSRRFLTRLGAPGCVAQEQRSNASLHRLQLRPPCCLTPSVVLTRLLCFVTAVMMAPCVSNGCLFICLALRKTMRVFLLT